MNVFLLLGLVFFVPVVLFIAYLMLSTCMGDIMRARIGGVPTDLREGSYGRTYNRSFGATLNQGGWEQIEMDNLMHSNEVAHDEEYER